MEKSGLNLATSQLKLKQENFMKTFQKPRQNQEISSHDASFFHRRCAKHKTQSKYRHR